MLKKKLPSQYIPREATDRFTTAIRDKTKAHLIIGPRQAGKSTFVWAILADLFSKTEEYDALAPTALLYLNCEERLIREWCQSPALFANDVANWLTDNGVIFFEEAQWLDDAGLFLKGLVDLNLNYTLIVTGSASFHLAAKTRESLAGRATRHRIWPLSHREVAHREVAHREVAHGEVAHQKVAHHATQETIIPEPQAPPAITRLQKKASANKALIYGGYPEAWVSGRPKTHLRELVESFIIRDASDRFRIERPDALRLILRLAAGQVGNLVNYTEWAQVASISVSTAIEYVSLLERTHILRLIRPYVGGKRAELTSSTKAFFIDNGLRNELRGGFSPLDDRTDLGQLYENWVFSELNKYFPDPGEIRYWRSKNGAEIDFVLEPDGQQAVGKRIIAIEVKAGKEKRKKLSRSMRSFLDAYAPSELWIIHTGDKMQDSYEQSGGVKQQYEKKQTPLTWIPIEALSAHINLLR